MKNIFIAIALCLSTFSVCKSQDSLSIDDVLQMDIRELYQQPNEDLQKLLYQLIPLGLDSFDLSADMFGKFSVEGLIIANKKDTKYAISRVVDSMLVFIQNDDYIKIKAISITTNRLDERLASKEDWLNYTKAEYTKLIKDFDLDRDKAIASLEAFEVFFLQKYKNQKDELKATYQDLFTEFNTYQKEQNKLGKLIAPSINNNQPPSTDDQFPSMNYHDALLNCTDSTKPIILYFTGYGCINARKIEDLGLFNTSTIYNLIKANFYFISLYVDDRTKLADIDKEKYSASYGRLIRTVGSLNVAIEEKLTASNSQPLIVIINTEGNVVSKPISYFELRDEEKFYKYLIENLEKFYRGLIND